MGIAVTNQSSALSSTYQAPFDTSRARYSNAVKVIFGTGDFSSKLVAVKDFSKGQVIARLEGITHAKKAWTSVQIGKDSHIELNSELVYMNHSCDPSVEIDTLNHAIVAYKDLKAGDDITFFYPSTEWEMSQPFDCWCGSSKCLKRISGAVDIPSETMSLFPTSVHIRDLMVERDASQ